MQPKTFKTWLLLFLLFLSCTKYTSTGLFSSNYDFGIVVPNAAQFGKIIENPFINTIDSSTSTFSVDADGASYATMRRWSLGNLGLDQIREAIRVEEFINYFPYN